jgi:hypothetical protein
MNTYTIKDFSKNQINSPTLEKIKRFSDVLSGKTDDEMENFIIYMELVRAINDLNISNKTQIESCIKFSRKQLL